MQFALDPQGQRIEAVKGQAGICPICQSELIPKCGRIKVHHWAHIAKDDCDPWYEPETEWHRFWKTLVPKDQTEVIMGEHRADIVTAQGWVLELQNSSIKPEEIRAREEFYGNMRWLVNAQPFVDRIFLLDQYPNTNGFKLRWHQMRAIWRHATKPVYFHLGNSTIADLLAEWEFRPFPGKQQAQKCIVKSSTRAAETNPLYAHSILALKTLHESGWGSVAVVPDTLFVRWLTGTRASTGFQG